MTPEDRYREIGNKAVVAQHPQISGFMAQRKWDDEGFVRAVIVEYIKHVAISAAKKSDEGL